MTYRELLDRCKSCPGWLASKEQKEIESIIKYRKWLIRSNEEYDKERNK